MDIELKNKLCKYNRLQYFWVSLHPFQFRHYEKMAMGNSFKCERGVFASFWKSDIIFSFVCIRGVYNLLNH